MPFNREYQPVNGQSKCTYSQMKGLNQASASAGQVAQSGTYIVPNFCPNGAGPNYPPRYDTLSHGQQYQCGGYFSIGSAYPYADCDNCKTTFVQRPCTDSIQCNGSVSESYSRNRKGYTRGMW